MASAARGVGPAAYFATAQWLRGAYADPTWQMHDAVAEGDLVVLHATMSGKHVGPSVTYGPDGVPAHWFRIADGL